MFQSSPLSQEGRYVIDGRLENAHIVSILAPLARGALPRKSSDVGPPSMFQSSPLSQEGRYNQPKHDATAAIVFQSSPLSQEGRYAQRQKANSHHS